MHVERQEDERAFLARMFCESEFAEHGLETHFLLDSTVFSPRRPGCGGFTIKSLRTGKSSWCAALAARQVVIVVLRPESTSYACWLSVELSPANGPLLLVPRGLARSYQTLADDTEVAYRMSHEYVPSAAQGVRWNDPAFGINAGRGGAADLPGRPRMTRLRTVAAICRLPVAARWLAAAALTVALAACGHKSPQTVTAASTTTDAGPTYLGNSFTLAGTGTDSVPHSVTQLAVSPDGYLMMGSSWEEYDHDARLFDPNTGALLGPYTPTRPHKGIYGVAADNTYVYYATGDGLLFRSARSSWDQPSKGGWYDDGSNTGAGPLIVDSRRYQLMGLAECDNELFVSDPNGPLGSNGQVSPNTSVIKVIPTSLSGVSASWSVPRARTIACDREGDIWVLQQGVSGGPGPDVERFTPTGTLLTSFSLPGYPDGLAADPNRDRLLVPDNGRDQDFKWFDYSGNQTGQIGVTGGYLADGGKIDSSHFVGPRAAAIDAAGDVFTAESALPGVGESVWRDYGPAAIFTKFDSSGAVKWRDYGLDFIGTGEPTNDGAAFFDRHFEYRRDASRHYQPYAFTVDPFANPADDRVAQNNLALVGPAPDRYGGAILERDMDGHHYIVDLGGPALQQPGPVTIYEQQANSEILKPVLTLSESMNDAWMTDSGDVWIVRSDVARIEKHPLTGFDASGVPQYGATVSYALPSQLNGARRIEVHGSTVYLSGFAPGDPNPANEANGWKSMGRHLLRFDSLPTSSGWATPMWEITTYTGSSTSTFPYTTSFAVDGNVIGVGWLYGPTDTNPGDGPGLQLVNASNGAVLQTWSPTIVSSYGHAGGFDMSRSIEAKNGWLWMEDDWQSKIFAICPSRSCH